MNNLYRAALAAAALSFAPFANAQPLAIVQQTITCGTSSTTVLAAGSAAFFVRLHVPSNASNPVFVNWAGGAATTAAPSEDVQPGGSVGWVEYAPSQEINCIASANTSIVVEYR